MKRGMMISIVLMFLGMGISTTVLAENASEPMVILQEKEKVTYDEIQKDEVPEAVLSAVKESFAGHELEKAFLGSDGNYKLKLTKGEEKIAAFFNANGNLLKVENAEDKQHEEKQRQ